MCEIKDGLLSKIFEQIEEIESKYNKVNSPQNSYFDCWDCLDDGVFKKDINMVNNPSKNRKLIIMFTKKGTHIPLKDFLYERKYIIIKGHVDYLFEDDTISEIIDFSAITIPKNKKHGMFVRKDSFIIVEEELN